MKQRILCRGKFL